MNIIEIEHLKKYYKDVKAVDDITFSVAEGEFFAFLGVNGAGKSTAISVLCGRARRTSGRVEICGKDVDADFEGIRKAIGVVFQESVLDRALSVRDNLKSRAALYGISGKEFDRRLRELSALFELSDFLSRPVGKLSGGQRRRVDVARAVLHEPRILILDEPTTGLDPQTRKKVWEIVHGLRKVRKMTVFLTTHYMEEADGADRVVILDGGKILANDTPLRLKERYASDFITLYHVREEDVKTLGLPYERTGDGFRVEIDPKSAAALIMAHPDLFSDFELKKGGMDDVFLAVTGKRTEGGV